MRIKLTTALHSVWGNIILILWLMFAPPTLAQTLHLRVQSSPLAGFQYHQGADVWSSLREGDLLSLRRDVSNRHDPRAIAVYWHDHLLGYLPRAENDQAALWLDKQGHSAAELRVYGRIGKLLQHANPWQRIRIDVFVASGD